MLIYPRDSTATLYLTISTINGVLVDSDTIPTVGIWDGPTQIVADMPMIWRETGTYYVEWDIPIIFPTGFYSAIYECTIQGQPTAGAENFEIIEPTDPTLPNYYCSWDDIKACLLGLDIGDMPTTLQDRMTQFYIPTLKMEIDNYCHQNFNRTRITEFYDGTGSDKLVLNRRPIASFTNCILKVIPSISWYTFMRWRQINITDSQNVTVATQGGPEPHAGKYPPYSPTDYDWESDIVKADLFIDCVNGIITIPPRILYLEMNAIPFWNYTWLRGNNNIEVTYDYGYEAANFPNDLRFAAAKLAACQLLLIKGIGISAGANSMNIDDVSRNFGGTPYQALIEDMRKQAFAILDKFRRIIIG